jgi:undecaprenyl pyrophosphate synthase
MAMVAGPRSADYLALQAMKLAKKYSSISLQLHITFGVKEISAYALSTENWKRSPEEVKS